MTKTRITILSSEVMADLRSASWLVSEINDPTNRHIRHEMADICEKDNIDAVWRVLGTAVTEVRVEMIRILEPQKWITLANELQTPESWEFSFKIRIPDSKETYLREKIHEYLVARVMADRTAAIIPAAMAYWTERREEAIAGIRLTSAGCINTGKARRLLWPFLP